MSCEYWLNDVDEERGSIYKQIEQVNLARTNITDNNLWLTDWSGCQLNGSEYIMGT